MSGITDLTSLAPPEPLERSLADSARPAPAMLPPSVCRTCHTRCSTT